MLGFTVTFDAAKVTADIRFHGENEFAIKITAIEGTLSYMMNWPRNTGTLCLFHHVDSRTISLLLIMIITLLLQA